MTSSGTLPHWDLSNVYPGLESPQFAQAVEHVKTKLTELEKYLAHHHIAQTTPETSLPPDSAALEQILSGYLDQMNALLRLHETLEAYVYCFVTTDSYNTTAKRVQSELDLVDVRVQQIKIKFQGWIGRIASLLPQALEHPGSAQQHAFYLKERAEQSKYMMSEAEESLASELGLSGEVAWSKLQGTVCSQVTVPFEKDGVVENLPITALQNLHHDLNATIRRRAYEAELAAWETVREPLAAALNGVKGHVVTLNQRRGRTDALHSALDQDRIDRETLEAMLGVMQDHLPSFRKYLKTKAARLGNAALPWWDIFAPVGHVTRHFGFQEAQDYIITQFGTFSDRLANLARRAFENHWIDAESRNGKQGGAFCTSVPTVDESRVLCNFDGSLDQVFTIAHELGHAFHNECKVGKTRLQTITPMTLAETASILCETIVTNASLAEAAGPEEELGILETYLVGATQVIVDIMSRYLFEKEVFERRAKSELSADDFCEIMLRCQQATYGDGLDPNYLHKYMWTWKPHYYRPGLSFYNFPYAFGLLFGTGLYAIYTQRKSSFVPEYETLLASTGLGTAADLAARFNIDIRQPAFWEGSLQIIEKRIERYTEIR